jgi:hypothetical protein
VPVPPQLLDEPRPDEAGPPMTTTFISCLRLGFGRGRGGGWLREGFGQRVRAEHHVVGAGLDPQGELTVVDAREPDHSVARPELGDAERRLLCADHDHLDVVQDWCERRLCVFHAARVPQAGRARIGQVASLSR